MTDPTPQTALEPEKQAIALELAASQSLVYDDSKEVFFQDKPIKFYE